MNKPDKQIIKEALTLYMLKEEAQISKQVETVELPSDEFYERLKAAVAEKVARREKRMTVKKAISAALVAALLIAMMALSVAGAGRLRGFMIEFFDGFAKLYTGAKDEKNMDARDLVIGYIPEGFECESADNSFDFYVLYNYKREKETLTIYCTTHVEASFGMDTEDSNFTEVVIGDYKVVRIEKNNAIVASWTDGKFIYQIYCTSSVGWDEMVKVIEGITYLPQEQNG